MYYIPNHGMAYLEHMARVLSYEPRARTTIANESNLICGEAIGVSSNTRTATKDDSGDGDDDGGDGDSDPERRKTTPRIRNKSKQSPISEVRNGLPSDGFVRLPQVLAVIPVSKSSWWAGVKSGRYPRPVKLSPRVTAWRVDQVRALIQSID